MAQGIVLVLLGAAVIGHFVIGGRARDLAAYVTPDADAEPKFGGGGDFPPTAPAVAAPRNAPRRQAPTAATRNPFTGRAVTPGDDYQMA